MSEPLKKETVAVIVMAVAFVVLMVVVLVWDKALGDPADSMPSQVENIDDLGEDWDELSQSGDYEQTTPSRAGARGGGKSLSGLDFDQLTKTALLAELRRILRAGRRLEALRSSANPTFTRRCLDVSKELQSDLDAVQSGGINIPIPAGAVSLDEIVSQARVCASCGDAARPSCVLAEVGLDAISR